ncbi:MAG: hypothetical protein ISS35_00770 [Kiritimatiellae bacterium]|nr:hypothetical protein [Kiritimatiellia bacterium]
MKMTPREIALLLATMAAALFGITFVLIQRKIPEWRSIRQQQVEMHQQIERDRNMIGKRAGWLKQFEDLSSALPNFNADARNVESHWLRLMSNKAGTHGVTIKESDAGDERPMGDVYELPIECKSWEGTLSALTYFLFDLQAEGAMLDVRYLRVKPKPGKQVLSGRFSLLCAYTRSSQNNK